jgi:threonine dehydrogenase-like Zn-dependent dehydrogenase
MRATVMHAAEDVRVEDVPDARIEEPTDAVIRITRACICGSDLWPYKSLDPSEGARIMGHEAIGVVEDTGSEVGAVEKGDLVVMRSPPPTAPAPSATKGCRPSAFTAASSVTGKRGSAARRPRHCASPGQTERSTRCRATPTRR